MNGNLSFLMAFLSAVVLAMFGYLKNVPKEDFDPNKLFSTFFAALFVAVLNVRWGVATQTGEEMFIVFLVNSGAVSLLERIGKTLWRRYVQPWIDQLEQ